MFARMLSWRAEDGTTRHAWSGLAATVSSVIFLAFQSAQPASAQDAEPTAGIAGTTQLQEIVVNALKRENVSEEVPFGLSVISRKQLEERRVRRVEEVVRQVPNVNFQGFSDGRSTNFNIRGVGAIHDPLAPGDTSVTVYVDGVPQPIFAADVGFFDLEQVEVLKGPQGTLFGRNTTGGAIVVSTRKPTDKRELSILSEIGNEGYKRSELVASGAIVPGKVNGRLALRYSEIDGFVPNTLTGDEAGDRDVIAGRGTLTFKPSSKTDVTFSLTAEQDDRTFPFFLLRNQPNFPITSSFDENNSRREVQSGALTVEHAFDKFDFTSVTGANFLQTDLYVDDTEGFFFSRVTGLPVSFFAANDSFTDWSEDQKTFSQGIPRQFAEGKGRLVGGRCFLLLQYVRNRLFQPAHPVSTLERFPVQ